MVGLNRHLAIGRLRLDIYPMAAEITYRLTGVHLFRAWCGICQRRHTEITLGNDLCGPYVRIQLGCRIPKPYGRRSCRLRTAIWRVPDLYGHDCARCGERWTEREGGILYGARDERICGDCVEEMAH